jgi:hypothetical protein
MLLACNRQNLKRFARGIFENLNPGKEWTADLEKRLIRECLKGFQRENYHHISHDERAHLDRIGEILGTYGTEGMLLDRKGNDLSGTCSTRDLAVDIQYCNAGDTYQTTILYHNGRLKIGNWGSIVERLG